MGEWLEVLVTEVTGQEDTAEELVAEGEGAGRLFSPIASDFFKQTANFYFNIYFHVGGFSPKLYSELWGSLMSLCIHGRPCALWDSFCCAQGDAQKNLTLNHYLSQVEV